MKKHTWLVIVIISKKRKINQINNDIQKYLNIKAECLNILL